MHFFKLISSNLEKLGSCKAIFLTLFFFNKFELAKQILNKSFFIHYCSIIEHTTQFNKI